MLDPSKYPAALPHESIEPTADYVGNGLMKKYKRR